MGSGDYKPPTTAKSMARIATGLEKSYPRIVQALGKQILPAAQYEQDAQAAIAPQQEALNAKLYAENAPIYSEGAAAADLAAIQGSGGQAVRAGDALSREIDPEYFATRDLTAQKLQALLSGMDPNKLTGAEMENTARGLARYGAKSGSLNTPTAGSAIKAALTYGSALNQKRNTVANAAGQSAAALPTFRSGVDTFGQATGRAGTSAFGGGFNTNAQSVGNAQAQGTNTAGMAGGLEQLRQQLMSQRRHYTDFVNQSYSASGISGLYGGCFILRECLGKLPASFERILPYLMRKSGMSGIYHKLAAVVVPEMRRNPEFKSWVTENFAKPLIAVYE